MTKCLINQTQMQAQQRLWLLSWKMLDLFMETAGIVDPCPGLGGPRAGMWPCWQVGLECCWPGHPCPALEFAPVSPEPSLAPPPVGIRAQGHPESWTPAMELLWLGLWHRLPRSAGAQARRSRAASLRATARLCHPSSQVAMPTERRQEPM